MNGFEKGNRVQITGNYSQGIRHFNKGSMGHIDVRRRGMLLKGEVVAVHAYHVRLDGGGFTIVAVEDLRLLKEEVINV
ncbi:hypothetical protein [Psychrobacillus sp. FSL K6-1464]|uniref:hypothetical protein n=1 Tax=Psychrobacillus sp. FSL K6-1464 TaxID=2921545 RepID=UPI0030F9D703